MQKNIAKEVSLYPVPTAGRGKSKEEKGEPAVGTRLVQLIFCRKTLQKKVSLYPVPTAGRGKSKEEKGEPAVGTRLVQLI
ncbi:hypothetical protein ACWFOV_08460, partial [Bacillus mycoides]